MLMLDLTINLLLIEILVGILSLKDKSKSQLILKGTAKVPLSISRCNKSNDNLFILFIILLCTIT